MPEPEMRNPAKAATWARAISQTNFNNSDYVTRDALQASRIVRLYVVTYATAATIARLCYSVVR